MSGSLNNYGPGSGNISQKATAEKNIAFRNLVMRVLIVEILIMLQSCAEWHILGSAEHPC